MSVLEEIKKFVVSEDLEKRKENLSSSTRLSEDLGLTGDDANDFLYSFSEKFQVDLSNFEFDKYFAAEGFDPIRLIKYLLGFKKYQSITLGDLERSVTAGKWVDSSL